jgi:hypothetical protein
LVIVPAIAMKMMVVVLLGIAFTALQAPEVGEVRDRLDAYLVAYEPQLSALVAEERMSQRDDARAVSKTALPTKYRAVPPGNRNGTLFQVP